MKLPLEDPYPPHQFDYQEAFGRNLGWVTKDEQQRLRQFRIGIVGLGGVGGHHLHALVRMGFSKFSLADFDRFSIQNFNRQFGASMSTLGQPKLDTSVQMAKDINPEVDIQCFDQGIHLENAEAFIDSVDLICDSLDLFASDLRVPIYEMAHKKGKYVMTAGPFGAGSSIVINHPKKMSFGQYFDLEDKNLSTEAKVIHFLLGVSPTMMHRRYVASPTDVDVFNHRLPSLHAGCYMASSLVAANIFKIALGRGKVLYAPWSYHIDLYLNKVKKRYIPLGNRNWIQRLKIRHALKYFKAQKFN